MDIFGGPTTTIDIWEKRERGVFMKPTFLGRTHKLNWKKEYYFWIKCGWDNYKILGKLWKSRRTLHLYCFRSISVFLLHLEKHWKLENALWFWFMEEIWCRNLVNSQRNSTKKSPWLHIRSLAKANTCIFIYKLK